MRKCRTKELDTGAKPVPFKAKRALNLWREKKICVKR